MFQDGTTSEYDPETGKTKVVPTFSILNPDAKTPVSQSFIDKAAKINPSFATAWDKTNGDVRLTLQRQVTQMHQVNSVLHAEDMLQGAADNADNDPLLKQLGLKKNVEDSLASAVRNDPQALRALLQYENANAQGGDTAAGLRRLLQAPGSQAIFTALGTTTDKAQRYIDAVANQKIADTERAKEGMLKPNAPASDAEKQAARDVIGQLPKEQQNEMLVTVNNPDGVTRGDVKDVMKQARDQYNKNRELDPNGTGISTTQSYPNEWVDPKTGRHFNLADSLFNAVEGNEDPTQFSKRSKTYNSDLARANEYSYARYGKPWDPAQATIDYKFAQNTGTQNTLKYLNSLTGANDTGGNLAELVNASNRVNRTDFPALNNAAAWARLETGNVAIAQYHTAVTEVADQVAKILQGGNGGGGTSDAKLKQANDLFKAGFSKDVLKGVADELRPLLANRKTELIGNNRYLQKQFPAATQSDQTSSDQTPDQKQQKLQAITMPGGGHPVDIRYGPNGAVALAWSGKAGDPWINVATGQPVK
jgi:hypothetical protein